MSSSDIDEPGLTIATFDDLASAEALQRLLQREGFAARVHDERKVQRFWFLARPLAGVHVRVAEGSIDGIQRLLQVHQAAEATLSRAYRCRSCGSSRVQYPAMTRKNLLPTLAIHLLVAVGLLKHEFYCENCHNTWESPAPRRTRLIKHTELRL